MKSAVYKIYNEDAKSVESLEQNLEETIAQSVDKMNIYLPHHVKSVFII